jgi:hypothetical protein
MEKHIKYFHGWNMSNLSFFIIGWGFILASMNGINPYDLKEDTFEEKEKRITKEFNDEINKISEVI